MTTLQKLICIIIGIIAVGFFLVAQNEKDIQSINKIFMPTYSQDSKIAKPKYKGKTQVERRYDSSKAKTPSANLPKLKDPSEDIKKLPQMNF